MCLDVVVVELPSVVSRPLCVTVLVYLFAERQLKYRRISKFSRVHFGH